MKPTDKINVNFARRVAMAYSEMKHEPYRWDVKRAYDMLALETKEQYCHALFGDTIADEFN